MLGTTDSNGVQLRKHVTGGRNAWWISDYLGGMRYEKGFIISNFDHSIVGDDKAVRKNKKQSPGFHPARTRDSKAICSRLRGQRNCKFPPCERKKHSIVRIEYFKEGKSA